MAYKIRVYVDHGYFEYEVDRMGQAMSHGHIIMAAGVYRRSISDSAVEFHKAH